MKRRTPKLLRRCRHRRTEIYSTGGFHFYAGEVWDDIREYLICLDCCKTVERGWLNWKERVRRSYNLPSR